jgi:hypothetical protein
MDQLLRSGEIDFETHAHHNTEQLRVEFVQEWNANKPVDEDFPEAEKDTVLLSPATISPIPPTPEMEDVAQIKELPLDLPKDAGGAKEKSEGRLLTSPQAMGLEFDGRVAAAALLVKQQRKEARQAKQEAEEQVRLQAEQRAQAWEESLKKKRREAAEKSGAQAVVDQEAEEEMRVSSLRRAVDDVNVLLELRQLWSDQVS